MSAPPVQVAPMAEPCYLVVCTGAPDAAALRKTHLDGHLRHVETHWQRYVTAGPVREPGSDAISGSVFLVLAPSLEEAQALMQGDPYITCGMYQTVRYQQFTHSIGRFIGGKIWGSPDDIRHRAAGGPVHDRSKGLPD